MLSLSASPPLAFAQLFYVSPSFLFCSFVSAISSHLDICRPAFVSARRARGCCKRTHTVHRPCLCLFVVCCMWVCVRPGGRASSIHHPSINQAGGGSTPGCFFLTAPGCCRRRAMLRANAQHNIAPSTRSTTSCLVGTRLAAQPKKRARAIAPAPAPPSPRTGRTLARPVAPQGIFCCSSESRCAHHVGD